MRFHLVQQDLVKNREGRLHNRRLNLWSLLRGMSLSQSGLNTSGSRSGRSQGSHLIPFHHPKWETPTLAPAALRGVNWTTSERESDASGSHFTDGRWRRILGFHSVPEKLKSRNISQADTVTLSGCLERMQILLHLHRLCAPGWKKMILQFIHTDDDDLVQLIAERNFQSKAVDQGFDCRTFLKHIKVNPTVHAVCPKHACCENK